MALTPRFETRPGGALVGLRRHHRYADAPRDIGGQWAELTARLPLPDTVGDAAYGVLCGNDPTAGTFEYMCGVEVAAFCDTAHSGLDRLHLPDGQRYAVFAHHGGVMELPDLWMEVFRGWLPASGLASAQVPDFERYGPGFDPATKRGDIELWVGITEA